ncbi:hypothetical protein [Tunturiibacter gelidiferens]|uniref:hypothetical protein n=1 Tax=Tunturiibacter gelidiferens TaxID=3069689 RepID=UPI003D9BCF99
MLLARVLETIDRVQIFVGSNAWRRYPADLPRGTLQRAYRVLIVNADGSVGFDNRSAVNTSVPSEDVDRFSKAIAGFSERMTTYASSIADPTEYGEQTAGRLCPVMLPYELGTTATFDRTRFNGRALCDDAMDVMLTLACNKPIADGVAPDPTRIRKNFPYYGDGYT